MTRIWRQLYSIGFWNADAWFTSTGLPDGPATLGPGICCPAAQHGSEFPEPTRGTSTVSIPTLSLRERIGHPVAVSAGTI